MSLAKKGHDELTSVATDSKVRSIGTTRKSAARVKNIYEYLGPRGQRFHGYQRLYKGVRLRRKGFITKSDAERDLRRAMNDVDARERGEVRYKPTTAQEALSIYRHNLDVRARDKGYQYGHNVKSSCKVLQEFVNFFGPNRLIRECTETDLREFYQILCFRRSLNRNSAGAFIGRIQGMLKAAQRSKPDLVNWLRPTLRVNRKPEFERRVVEDSEYAALVNILLNPPLAPSRRAERNALWREAGDAVQLLRMTGARFNELLRMTLDQFKWSKGTFTLCATKTENERELPIWDCVRDVVQRRVKEGLADGEYLFPRARTKTFDNAIARACRKAAKLAKLSYGQANGFTLHSLRHTFVTRMMEATGNDVALVMAYSGHRSMESFKVYLHATQRGSILANQHMESVGHLLATFAGIQGTEGTSGTESESSKSLELKEVAL